MSSIEFLFDQPSALIDRIGAPRSKGGGRYEVDATLALHLDHGDVTIARLDRVLHCLSSVAEAVDAADAEQVQAVTMTCAPGDEVRVRLAEVDPVADVVVDEGAGLAAAAVVRQVQARIDTSGVSLSVRLRFDVRADQVAQLVRLLGATRAQASSDQLSLLGAHPDGPRAAMFTDEKPVPWLQGLVEVDA